MACVELSRSAREMVQSLLGVGRTGQYGSSLHTDSGRVTALGKAL